MPNVGETESYRFVDHVSDRAVRVLSRFVGAKNITRPFWNRWRASMLGDDTVMRFLAQIDSIDDWPAASMKIVREEEASLELQAADMTHEEHVAALRRLSYLCFMAQWGYMAITPDKIAIYKRCRDYYIQAETLAHGNRYKRISIPWADTHFWGNLHLPAERKDLYPVILILHGMDDCKEEHLASELALQEAGFAVFCFDGPGQAEALYLDNQTWPPSFEDVVSRALTTLAEEHGCDPNRAGVIGISWGGMWAVKSAACDQRIHAVFDLGGPIDTTRFSKLPYFLKSRFCQVFGVNGPDEMVDGLAPFVITDDDLLMALRCPVRIVHGGKDPLVPVSEKEWLRDKLKSLHPDQDVSLLVFPDGDHCCTGHALEVRNDGAAFFSRTLLP